MAVPKKRKSHSRTRTHRAHNALRPSLWVTCAQCRSPMTLHRICPTCGYYRGRPVIAKQSQG